MFKVRLPSEYNFIVDALEDGQDLELIIDGNEEEVGSRIKTKTVVSTERAVKMEIDAKKIVDAAWRKKIVDAVVEFPEGCLDQKDAFLGTMGLEMPQVQMVFSITISSKEFSPEATEQIIESCLDQKFDGQQTSWNIVFEGTIGSHQ